MARSACHLRSISQHSGTFTALDISFWLFSQRDVLLFCSTLGNIHQLDIKSNRCVVRLFLLVVLEIGTDWIKFCLITKFSEMQTKTFEAGSVLYERLGDWSPLAQIGTLSSLDSGHRIGLGTKSSSETGPGLAAAEPTYDIK